MKSTYCYPSNRVKTERLSGTEGRRGASLLQVLCVTAVFALLSAVLFPRIATPTRMATVGIIESASTLGAKGVWQQSKAGVESAFRHGIFNGRHVHIEKRPTDAISGDFPGSGGDHSA